MTEVLHAGGDAFPMPAGEIAIPPLLRTKSGSTAVATPMADSHIALRDSQCETLYNHNPSSQTQLSPLLEGNGNGNGKPRMLRQASAEKAAVVKPLGRGAPGDGSATARLGADEAAQSKRRSQFYGEVFAYREPLRADRDAVLRDAVVTAELKTNVIVRLDPLFPSIPVPTGSLTC